MRFLFIPNFHYLFWSIILLLMMACSFNLDIEPPIFKPNQLIDQSVLDPSGVMLTDYDSSEDFRSDFLSLDHRIPLDQSLELDQEIIDTR